jgi:ATP-dependent Clp protease ATP-binding subunit ClpC
MAIFTVNFVFWIYFWNKNYFMNMENKFNFDLKKVAIYQAIKWSKVPLFKLAGFFKKTFLILFVFAFSAFLFLFLLNIANLSIQSLALGLSLIFLSLFLTFFLVGYFFNSKLKNPKIKSTVKEILSGSNLEKYNLADFLSFKTAKAISKSIIFAKKKNLSQINSTLLFYFLVSDNKNLNFIFSRALLDYKEIKNILKNYIETIGSKSGFFEAVYSKDFQESIFAAFKIAAEKNRFVVEVKDIIIGLAEHDLIFKRILIDNNLKIEDIENLTWWLENLENKIKERKEFWLWKNLVKKGSLGKTWATGYTLSLDKFATDLSELIRKKGFPEIIGHKKEIEALERILSGREKNNVLVVGESGSGRKSMIYELAKKSALGESLPEVNYKRVVQLNLSNLLAETFSNEEMEFALDNIFKEVIFSGNVILVIDEFHNFVGSKIRPGAMDISAILAPYLAYPSFQIIAISTFEGFHKYIEQDSSLLSLFEKVEVSEILERETLMLLENMSLVLEKKYGKFISYSALRDIIAHCAKYLPAIAFPEKAIDLLDDAMVYISQTKEKILLPKHIAKIVTEKTQIPVGEIQKQEKNILLNLEDLIHQRIIGQEEAVKEISTALRRARSEISIRKGPMGTFLFLGPTGVGKTETSKALAEIYFGSGQRDKSLLLPHLAAAGLGEERMIRLDMSEFQSVSDIPRLLGSPGEEGFLTTEVRKRPFSLILLDEIEKAHPNILNLFLQVLDEGHLTDGLGRKVDFKNSIIIATSNAGYQIILKALRQKTEWSELKQELLDYLFEEGIFRPEFINRFDAMVVFKSLTKENLLMIAELMLKNLKKNLKKKEIEFVISDSIKEKIVELGYDPTFGARKMRRVIQDKIENVLASALLSGQIKKGSKIEIDSNTFQIKT